MTRARLRCLATWGLIGLVLVGWATSGGASPFSGTVSVTAAENTSGLQLVLRCPVTASEVVGVAEAGAAATVTYDISWDGSTWWTHTTLLAGVAGVAVLEAAAAPYIRLASSTTGVALTFALSCHGGVIPP